MKKKLLTIQTFRFSCQRKSKISSRKMSLMHLLLSFTPPSTATPPPVPTGPMNQKCRKIVRFIRILENLITFAENEMNIKSIFPYWKTEQYFRNSTSENFIVYSVFYKSNSPDVFQPPLAHSCDFYLIFSQINERTKRTSRARKRKTFS